MSELENWADGLRVEMVAETQRLHDLVEKALRSHIQKQQDLLQRYSNEASSLKTKDDLFFFNDEPNGNCPAGTGKHNGIGQSLTAEQHIVAPTNRNFVVRDPLASVGEPTGSATSKSTGHTHKRSVSMAERHRQYKSEIDEKSWFRTLLDRLRIREFLTRLSQLEEPRRSGRFAGFVKGYFFETLCSVVILLNSAFSIYTTNYEITNLDATPNEIQMGVELAFVIFYTWEIIMKFAVHRLYLFVGPNMSWNAFDFLLVVLSIYDQILLLIVLQGGQGTSVTFMRSMRILKIAKISRTIRLMRVFASLRTILNSLLGSLYSLFWSISMLTLIFFLFALVFVQRASLALKDSDVPDPDLTLERFGSVQVAMLSLYMSITGGDDWHNFYSTLRGTGWLNAALFIFFIAFMQIAVLNILTGIFVEQAMKSAQPDRASVATYLRQREMMEAEELRAQCRQIDADRSGVITLAELAEYFDKGKLKHMLMTLDIDVRDVEVFFDLLRSHDDEIRVEDFVEECMKLKGSASSIDLHHLTKRVCEIQRTQDFQHDEIMEFLRHVMTSGVPSPRDLPKRLAGIEGTGALSL